LVNSEYGKYIVTELKEKIAKTPWSPPVPVQRAGKGRGGRLLYLDSEVVPGSFYVEAAWSFPSKDGDPPKTVAKAHSHDYDEVLCMCGTDTADPYDLCGEVEFWLGGERHIITRSCMIFIPRGVEHCPLTYLRVDKPIFNFTTGPGRMYLDPSE
jgi:hypothetical protein